LALASRAKAFPRRRPTPDGEDNPDHRALPTFFSGDEGNIWGDLYGQTRLAWKQALEAESEWERDRFAAREFFDFDYFEVAGPPLLASARDAEGGWQ
jgi:hypothetical protein